MVTQTDSELIEQARGGDRGAFERLVGRHEGRFACHAHIHILLGCQTRPMVVRCYFAFPVRNTSRYGTAGLLSVSRKLLNLPRLNHST